MNVEADYEWDLDAENDDMVTLDNDIEDISNLVEQVQVDPLARGQGRYIA